MFKTLRYTTSLAWDFGEALLAVFNCNNVTDQIWANAVAARRADQLVDKEAGEDVAEPDCTCWPEGLAYHALDCHLWYGTETPAGGEAPNPPADAPPSQTFPTAGQPNLRVSANRFVLIDETGCRFDRTGVAIDLSVQDDGLTLKAFVKRLPSPEHSRANATHMTRLSEDLQLYDGNNPAK